MNATLNGPGPRTDLPPRISAPVRTRSLPRLLLALSALAAGGFLTAGIVPRLSRDASAVRTQDQAGAIQKVVLDAPRISSKAFDLTLPGGTRALLETTLYARTSGFVSQILADIGDPVQEGQLLAVIESPEVDEELVRARVRVQEAKVNLVLAQSTLERLRTLLKTRAVSEQESDDQQARVNSAEAALRGGEADVRRLESLQSFERVLAPFSGVITSRSTEKGNLVTAGSGAALPSLFTLAQVDTLRIFLDVPQKDSVAVRPGARAQILVRELPGRTFEGKVVRTSAALDPASRTLLTEIHLPNPEHRLLPGMYVQVKLSLERVEPTLLIPARTLAILNSGPHVVTVEPDGTIRHRAVTLGRDFGGEIEIAAGLTGTEKLVANPPDSLKDGQSVVGEAPAPLAQNRRHD